MPPPKSWAARTPFATAAASSAAIAVRLACATDAVRGVDGVGAAEEAGRDLFAALAGAEIAEVVAVAAAAAAAAALASTAAALASLAAREASWRSAAAVPTLRCPGTSLRRLTKPCFYEED